MIFVVTTTFPSGEVEKMAMASSPKADAIGVATVAEATKALYLVLQARPKGFNFPPGASFKVEPASIEQ